MGFISSYLLNTLTNFYNPLKKDELEQSTEVTIVFKAEPKPVWKENCWKPECWNTMDGFVWLFLHKFINWHIHFLVHAGCLWFWLGNGWAWSVVALLLLFFKWILNFSGGGWCWCIVSAIFFSVNTSWLGFNECWRLMWAMWWSCKNICRIS